MKISKGGQISIPAPIRRRWGTSTVNLRDEGGHIVIEPTPDDPIAAAEGVLGADFAQIDVERLREMARQDEQAAEVRHRSR
jgi:AbrB family looped-hinge helix DNA binding protein